MIHQLFTVKIIIITALILISIYVILSQKYFKFKPLRVFLCCMLSSVTLLDKLENVRLLQSVNTCEYHTYEYSCMAHFIVFSWFFTATRQGKICGLLKEQPSYMYRILISQQLINILSIGNKNYTTARYFDTLVELRQLIWFDSIFQTLLFTYRVTMSCQDLIRL